jgi:protein-S-isoprenylcysteine O-methyltransferase Ste14
VRLITLLPRTRFPACCAVVVFGLIHASAVADGRGSCLDGRGSDTTVVCFALFAEAYRFVRNPMALGALTVLAGWGLAQRSVTILLFALCMAALMHVFVAFVEEPKRERRFGQSYRAYKSRVHRWMR